MAPSCPRGAALAVLALALARGQAPERPAWLPVEEAECSRDTGGTCRFLSCKQSRGGSGVICSIDGRCLCGPDMCAEDGSCVPRPVAASPGEGCLANYQQCKSFQECPDLPDDVPGYPGRHHHCCGDRHDQCCSELQMPQCEEDDHTLLKWTKLRYMVLAGVMMFRVLNIVKECKHTFEQGRKKENMYKGWEPTDLERLKQQTEENPDSKLHAIPDGYFWANPWEGSHPFCDNPIMSSNIIMHSNKCSLVGYCIMMFWAGLLFIQSEGVGLAVYFGVAAMMDNVAIFFVTGFCFCKYVTAVSLYTMALVTFLPTALFALFFQREWYQGRPWTPLHSHVERWYRTKVVFLVVMVFITMFFFVVRLKFIKLVGYDAYVNEKTYGLVWTGIFVPPMIDLVQSLMLVMAGKKSEESFEVSSPGPAKTDNLTPYKVMLT